MIRRSLAALDDGQFRRDLDDDGRLSAAAITDALTELNLRRNVAKRLGRYYMGEDSILSRKLKSGAEGSPDNRIPVPYARKLVNTVVGYMYKPGAVQMQSNNEALLDELQAVTWANREDAKTSRLGKLSSIFGVSYEIHYVVDGNTPRFAPVPVEDFLPVYNNDIEPEVVAGIHRYIEHVPGEANATDSIEHVDIYYADVIQYYKAQGTATTAGELRGGGEEPHGYGLVPCAVFRNNDEIMGDYEHILHLIDSYDVLMSDSMNEFDRFAWAYLVLKNLRMTSEDVQDIKVKRVIEVMEQGGAEFLTKDIQTAFVEFLRDWIREEIHKQTHIPDMADQSFAGDQSGIAIRYKLSDLENIASVKEIGFREGLYRRIELLLAFFRTQGRVLGTSQEVWFTFNRNIPQNYVEQAEIIGKLRGHISHKTLLDEVATFVDDSQAELDALAEEQDVMSQAFGFGGENGIQEEGQEEEAVTDEPEAG